VNTRGPDAAVLLDVLAKMRKRRPINQQTAEDVGRILGYATAVPGYQGTKEYLEGAF
jgi:hypothetical protein